ncbi:hypothetical protein M501DRAFT_718885 [Patellaria atrata CBS 101060]|uniref:Fungal N-terminal domain-containing protein n=1 Tax=Patellaria atrata CBS 101060 TaxID=1346257 RepID=A0A9P4SBE0_9PEZI|nr:hypothetical protein M501DRAFT_718885 [Patellaria atrata CBS 101060]
MSGSEFLQVFASAATTIELALRLYKSLATFVAKARNADRIEKSLFAKTVSLRQTLFMVHITLRTRRGQIEGEEPTRAESCVWMNLNDSLKSWENTIRNFKTEMRKLKVTSNGKMTWIDKVLWALKYDRRNPNLMDFSRDLSDHIAELSLSLQCLSV